MQDPYFERAVVLMIEHQHDEGSLGLVINHAAPLSVTEVLEQMEIQVLGGSAITNDLPLLHGGPVEPDRGWVLHTPDWRCEETRDIAEGMAVTASTEVLVAIAGGRGPERYRFLLGYAGWQAAQLVDEIKSGAWLTVPYETELVFDVPIDDCWTEAIGRLGFDPGQLATVSGDA